MSFVEAVGYLSLGHTIRRNVWGEGAGSLRIKKGELIWSSGKNMGLSASRGITGLLHSDYEATDWEVD